MVSGTARCLRPLPRQRTWAPAPRARRRAVESGQFGDPQAGLDGQQQQRAVAAAFPAAAVGRVEEGVDLGCGEKRDQLLVEPFGRDGQHPLDELGVLGVTQGRVGEQRADRGQAQVAGARAVVPVVFEVVEERRDQVRVEVGPVQRGRAALSGALLGEPEQQLERVAVGGDGAWADLTLLGEPVGEERLAAWGRSRSSCRHLPARLQALRGQREQLGCGRQVPVRRARIAMPEIGRQRRQLGLDVGAAAIPAQQGAHREPVAQVVNPRRRRGIGSDSRAVAEPPERLLHDR